MAEITVDERRLPIVVVRYPPAFGLEQLHELFARYDVLSRRHPRLAYIIDMRAYNPVTAPADARKTIGDLFLQHREVLLRATVCEARVVSSTVVRVALAAVDAVSSTKWPCKSFATMAEAEAWVAEQLEKDRAKGPKSR